MEQSIMHRRNYVQAPSNCERYTVFEIQFIVISLLSLRILFSLSLSLLKKNKQTANMM